LETVCNRKGCHGGRCQPRAQRRVIMLRLDNLSALEVDRCSDGAAARHFRLSCIRKLIKPQENLIMKKTLSSLTVAVLALFGAQAAMAQTAAAPTRADVKKETAAANKAGAIPATEAQMQTPPVSKQSDKARADVKKDTAAANKAGAISDTGASNVPGDAAGQKSPKQAAATTDTTRAARKDATAAANKAGAIPATEAQMQAPKK
jgi:Domain of unknown function (DUF4148)